MTDSKNKETLLHRLAKEVWLEGKREVIDELFAPGLVVHAPMGEIIGPEGFKTFYDNMTAAFSDISMRVVFSITEGDLCLARFEFSARGTGDFMGISARGKDINVTGNSLVRIKDGQIIEGWDEYNLYGMMQQLGAVPPLPLPSLQ